MSEITPLEVLTTLSRQREVILAWFGTSECQTWCAVCARRAGLTSDMAGDVRSETWVRVSQSLNRRSEYFPEMLDISAAHRYAARACERTAIDLSRSARRRSVALTVDDDDVDPASLDAVNALFTSVMVDQWRRTLMSVVRAGHTCSGCSDDVVVATALRILNSFAMGDRGSMRDLLYEAMAEADDRMRDDRDAATRQRKSRCGRCVVALLRSTAEQMGFRL